MGDRSDDLDTRVVLFTLQDHLDAGRSPVEAAGEVLFLDELMSKDGLVGEELAAANRKAVEAWLADTLKVPREDLGPHLARAAEYSSFLRERVTTGKGLEWMRALERAWREWRQTEAQRPES